MTVHRDKFKLIFVFHINRDIYFSLLLDFFSSPLFTSIQHYSIYRIKFVLCLFENSTFNLSTLCCISGKYS
ncbi:hypothetical protein FY206_00395 [Enterobacter chengduensis]|nr:hypothetical protein FY206_00395 [Enterobacter chengduensis]